MNILLFLAVSAVCLGQTSSDLPEGLANLNTLVSNESGLVDAMRGYDRQETALAEKELREAKHLIEAGNNSEAEAKSLQAQLRFQHIRKGYEFVLANYKSNARAQTYYGELLYDRFGEIDGALQAWHVAVILDPKLSTPLNDLGIHYCANGEYERGLNALNAAIKLDPKNPDYLFNLAQIYLVNFPQVQEIRKWNKEQVYQEAMRLSKNAAEYAPNELEIVQDYAVNFFAAENFDVKVDWKKAAKAWQRARPLAQDEAGIFFTWINEGRVWLREGNKTKAAECLSEALKIMPDSDVAKQLLDQVQAEAPIGQDKSSQKLATKPVQQEKRHEVQAKTKVRQDKNHQKQAKKSGRQEKEKEVQTKTTVQPDKAPSITSNIGGGFVQGSHRPKAEPILE